jgi:hypothetical protein
MKLDRRTFLKASSAFLTFLGVRKAEAETAEPTPEVCLGTGPIAAPMIADFKDDYDMASAICRTHNFIDLRTGKQLVNPDGGVGIFYGDELTGVCRAYRVKAPYRDMCGNLQTKYIVYVGTNEERDPTDFYVRHDSNGNVIPVRPYELAWHEFKAPIRFVPIKGMEAEAAEVRARFDARAFERALRKQRWEEAGSPTLYGLPIYVVDRLDVSK